MAKSVTYFVDLHFFTILEIHIFFYRWFLSVALVSIFFNVGIRERECNQSPGKGSLNADKLPYKYIGS